MQSTARSSSHCLPTMSCMPSQAGTRVTAIALATFTVVIVFCAVYSLFRVGLYFVADAILRIIHHEYHAYFQRNQAESETDESGKASNPRPSPGNAGNRGACVACVIAYREDEAIFERCLRSYTELGTSCKAFVLGVDGDGPDDLAMTAIFRKVGH